jgi:thiopurine S-methyltransferase
VPDMNFWNERWLNNQIGFHQQKPHPSLLKFVDVFKDQSKVLVPLCGKTLDMIYLRDRGFEVIGVEFSELAILDFIKENKLTLAKTTEGDFQVYRGEGFTLYQGDFFKLSKEHLKGVTACYDRASMVAFDPAERIRYAEKLKTTGESLSVCLVVVFNYGEVAGGPPYSVVNEEIKNLYQDFFELTILNEDDFPLRDNLKERGATYEKETTWKFLKKN